MQYEQIFKNNFYISENFAKIFEPFIKISFIEINNKKIPIYKKKTIGFHTYSEEEIKELNKSKIKVSLLKESEGNYFYFFIPTNNYEEACTNYNKNFKKNLRRAEKNNLIFTEQGNLDDLMNIYKKRMTELNTLTFPKKYFEHLKTLCFVKIFYVKHNEKTIAFGLAFENENNVYFSQASDLKEFRHLETGYFLYDQMVKYATSQNKYLHLGINHNKSGQAIFKERMGASKLQAITIPEDQRLELFQKALKFPLTGPLLRIYANTLFKSFLGNAIPFT